MTEYFVSMAVLCTIVLLLRAALKGRIRPCVQYAIWLIVVLRAVMPVSLFSTPLSVMNAISMRETAEIAQTYELDGDGQAYYVTTADGANTQMRPDTAVGQMLDGSEAAGKTVLKWIYISGAAVMLLVFAASNVLFYIRLRRSRVSVDEKCGKLKVYTSSEVRTPCLFGFPAAAIYLTQQACDSVDSRRFAVAHESTHFRHGDHIWGLVRCAVLCVHWFDPLVWAAAFASKRDSEIACDEGTIKRLGEEYRIPYAKELISMASSSGKADVLCCATTMTEGKRGIKERIRLIAKKPRTYVIAAVAAVAVIAAAAVITMTGKPDSLNQEQYGQMLLQLAEQDSSGEFYADASQLLDIKIFNNARIFSVDKDGDTAQVTMWYVYQSYVCFEGEIYSCGSGGSYPVVASLDTGGGQVLVTDVWQPRDGGYYAKSIREKCGLADYLRIMMYDRSNKAENAVRENQRQAQEYFGCGFSDNIFDLNSETGEYKITEISEGTDKDGQYYFDAEVIKSGVIKSEEPPENSADTAEDSEDDTSADSNESVITDPVDGHMKLDIKEGTLTNEGAEIIFTNTTPVAINIEEYYKLQKLEDGQYIELDYIIPYDMIGWEGGMGVVDPGEKLELYVRWADLYGQLEPGDYVLTKHFSEIANTYLYAFHIE